MNYEIIKTQANSEKLTSYSLFTRKVQEDNLTADTYGIIAVDFDSSVTIDDVATDFYVADALLNLLTQSAVRVAGVRDCVIDYLSNL